MVRDGERGASISSEADALYALGARCIRGGRPFAARRHFQSALRLDPAREEFRRGFVFADQCCRAIYLPQYFLVQLYRLLPGGRLGVWVLLLLGALPLLLLDASPSARALYAAGLVLFCLYSWSAHWLVELWVRRFPPR